MQRAASKCLFSALVLFQHCDFYRSLGIKDVRGVVIRPDRFIPKVVPGAKFKVTLVGIPSAQRQVTLSADVSVLTKFNMALRLQYTVLD